MFGNKKLKKENESLKMSNINLLNNVADLEKKVNALTTLLADANAKLLAAEEKIAFYEQKEEARKEQTRKAALARWSKANSAPTPAPAPAPAPVTPTPKKPAKTAKTTKIK